MPFKTHQEKIEYQKNYYLVNKDRLLEKQRVYSQKPEVKKHARINKRAYEKICRANPEWIEKRKLWMDGYRQLWGTKFKRLKEKARTKKLIMTLTLNDCEKIWIQPCEYCGGECLDTKGGYGIDRINSKKGYELGNVVPCCSICNRAKFNSSREEFEKWILKIIKYHL